MSFTTKAGLKTALGAWLKRAGISTQADDCLTLCEARLNRDLGEVLTDDTITGVVSSNAIDVSSLSVAMPIGVFRIDTAGEYPLTQKIDGTYARSLTDGTPVFWSLLGDNIVFDCPCISAYTFRFKYRQRFTLAADGDTNWLLTNHPDIYLAAAIVWGALYLDDDGKAGKWAAVLEQGIPSVKRYISAQNRSVLSLDPGLSDIGRSGSFHYTTGE